MAQMSEELRRFVADRNGWSQARIHETRFDNFLLI